MGRRPTGIHYNSMHCFGDSSAGVNLLLGKVSNQDESKN